MESSASDLHIFFLPLLASGHMIPMLDLSILISARGPRSTIVTTPANAKLLRPSLSDTDNPNIHLLTIPFTSDESIHLPENLTGHPIPDTTPEFFASLCRLEPHFESLLLTHRPDLICLEGIAAGVPMVTWPLFADQQFNERFLVDVLGVGVSVGSVVNSTRPEERTVVVAERVAAAVEAVMGGGEEAEERRRKASEMKEAAARAVGEGGSSEVDLGRMVEELMALKINRIKETAVNERISA
ncbi:UDP-glycosyltransferase 73C6 [Dendrobium catenatum]|uniref:UDP-glycosyltransferase 73C6 n=1 Tax=Dendrobium catenatum TaxID=906689 RepID=A0A2I0W097_9ASPA|nr:UDP-glycosyltransferase 73C6 [Dendrobium catenatum]